jgi:hypothetical protein
MLTLAVSLWRYWFAPSSWMVTARQGGGIVTFELDTRINGNTQFLRQLRAAQKAKPDTIEIEEIPPVPPAQPK